MAKATEVKLSDLHGMVAEVLTQGLEACKPELEDGELHYDARLVGQAMAFLKDNDISVDIAAGADQTEVQLALEAIRNKKRDNKDPFADIPHH